MWKVSNSREFIDLSDCVEGEPEHTMSVVAVTSNLVPTMYTQYMNKNNTYKWERYIHMGREREREGRKGRERERGGPKYTVLMLLY